MAKKLNSPIRVIHYEGIVGFSTNQPCTISVQNNTFVIKKNKSDATVTIPLQNITSFDVLEETDFMIKFHGQSVSNPNAIKKYYLVFHHDNGYIAFWGTLSEYGKFLKLQSMFQTKQSYSLSNNKLADTNASSTTQSINTTTVFNQPSITPNISNKKIKHAGCGFFCVVLILIGIFAFILAKLLMPSLDFSNEPIKNVDNVNNYADISIKELKEKFGEPESTDKWTNKTTHGNFKLTTLSYTKNSNHYEFIIADNSVVRVTIYSSKYWNGTGDLFSYPSGNKDDIAKMFGVTLSNNAVLNCDNNNSYIYSPANEKIDVFNVQDIDINNNTFGFVKITYNNNYFD